MGVKYKVYVFLMIHFVIIRCGDVCEFGSNLSTIYDDGHVMLPTNPLDTDSDWVCDKTGVTRKADDVKEQLAKIGVELEVSQKPIYIHCFEVL